MPDDSRPPKKNQHTVPECYLREFANEQKRFYSFDKLHKWTKPAGISRSASSDYFYDFNPATLTNPEDDLQWAENTFHPLEGRFRKALDACLTEAQAGELSVDTGSYFAPFIAIQWLRTIGARKELVEANVKITQEMVSQLYDFEFPKMRPGKFVINSGYESVLQASMMLDCNTIYAIAERFWNLFWYVGRNRTDQQFYTSDTPIVRHRNPPVNDSPSVPLGVGLEFAYPLSSEFTLVMQDRHMLSQRYGKSFEEYERKTVNFQAAEVERFNALQVRNSNRYVYCLQDKFDLAMRLCGKDDRICDPNRERIKFDTTLLKNGFGVDFLMSVIE